MLRSTLIAAGAAVLCTTGFAQNTLDASKVYPITSPVKDAGTFNVNTRRWMAPSQLQTQQAVGLQIIYDNTCSWTGGAFYTGTGACESYYDEGIIPGPGNLDYVANGGDPTLTTTFNNVILFQFGYCTNFANPGLTIGFYNSLGGFCVGGVTPTGGANSPTLEMQACPAARTAAGINDCTAYYDLGALGIPGDATPGGAGVSCWLFGAFLGNTGFCIQSDGDGIWDNSPDADRFNWSWEMGQLVVAGTGADGIILAGEPNAAPGFGACSYNIPCAADPLTGAACGTGFGQDDGFWINVDRDPAGTPNTGAVCVSAPAPGTGCYWFGGHPGNPYGGFWMVMLADGECSGAVALVTDCQTAPTVTQGCNSTASTSGFPSASGAGVFTVTFGMLNQNVNGVVFYGTNGPNFATWSAQSNLCVKAPTTRLGGVPGASGSTGDFNGAAPCGGQYSFNMNAVIVAAGITAGTCMDVQAWTRDPASAKTTQLSDSLSFIVGL